MILGVIDPMWTMPLVNGQLGAEATPTINGIMGRISMIHPGCIKILMHCQCQTRTLEKKTERFCRARNKYLEYLVQILKRIQIRLFENISDRNIMIIYV
jgi:hypothetical protein